MSPFWKKVLDVVAKPPAEALLTELTAEETANVAAIEATVGSGVSAGEATINFFIGKAKSTNPIVNAVEGLAEVEWPQLEAELSTALTGEADATVPQLYAKGLAWFSGLVATL